MMVIFTGRVATPGMFSVQQACCLLLAMLFTATGYAAPAVLDVKQGGSASFIARALDDRAQLALVPGGVYPRWQTALAAPARSLASDGEYALVASGEYGLRVFALAPDAPPRLQTQLSGNIVRVLWHGDYAYLLDPAGWLRIADVQDREHPLSVSRYPLSALPDALAVRDDYLYLTTGKQLTVLDIRQPQTPREVARFALSASVAALQVVDGYAYLAAPQTGMLILDVRDLNRIRTVAHYPGEVNDLAVAGNLAYLANGATGLTIVDVGTPQQPRWKGSLNPIGTAHALRYTDGFVVMTNERNEIMRIDVRNPAVPQLIDSYYSAQPVGDFAAMQQQVWAVTPGNIQMIDFSPPPPTLLNLGVNFGGSRRAVIRDDILFVADWFSGLHLYDISQPDAPRHVSAYHTRGSSKGVLVSGNYAFIADDDHGLQILDISRPEQPRKVSEIATPGLAYTMKRAGDYIYLADHRGGFHIISITDIAHPLMVGSVATAGKAWAVEVVGDRAYIAADRAGLLVFDVSNPKQPKQIAAYAMGGTAEDVVIRDRLAYVANYESGLHVLDISRPAQPREIAHLATPGNARGIELDGDYAYIADWISGIQVVNISDPAQPALAGAYDTIGWSWGVRVRGDYAYVLDWWGGISVLDISTPRRPTLAGTYHARGQTRDVVTRDSYAYVAAGENGLQIFDIKNPLNPIWMGALNLSGEAQSLWLDGHTVYVARGKEGVSAVDIGDPFSPQPVANYLPLDTTDVQTRAAHANLIRVQGTRLYIAETGRGIAVIDTDSGKQSAWYPSALNDFWTTEQHLLIATATHIDILPTHSKYSLEQLPQGAELLRFQEGLLAIYRPAAGILLYDYPTLEPLGSFNPGEKIVDMKLGGKRLYASGASSGLLVLDISDTRHPRLQAAYPAARNIAKFGLSADAAFLAGNETLNEIELLPDSNLSVQDGNQVTVTVPQNMPLGGYHLLALNPENGARQIYPDVLRIVRPQSSAPRFTLEDLENALRERGMNPKGHQ